MLKTTKTMLAIASLLTVTATAMAAPASHRAHRMNAHAQAYGMSYARSTGVFQPNYRAESDTLCERAKGNID